LKRLEAEGFLQSVPRLGYLVNPISVSDIKEIYELRLVLEKAAARLAALRATPEQFEHLRQMAEFTYVYQDRQSYNEFLDFNTQLHTQIALAAGNQRLAEILQKLLENMVRIFHIGLELRDSAEEMRAEHRSLVQALADRDADTAEKLVEDQIARSQQRVLQMLHDRMHTRKSDLDSLFTTNQVVA
jgi:DNA-binding GntR family transcriptional regulator